MQPRCVDDTFAQFTSFGTAYLRAIESMRSDRIVNDPFAGGLLARSVDQAFERMDQVMKEENVPLIAKKADYIVANLADDDWDSKLLAHGFDPSSPTFWIMEGLRPYMKRSCILTLLDALDGMSAPCSEFWADMVGEATFNFGDTAVTMKYSDDDPLHGVLSKIPWCLRLQASLKNGGIHFGRKWTPLISQDTNKTVSITFIMGKKPVSSEARLKDVCPGLDY
ncbi:mitochondrial chaperone BCS1-B [Phytophthora nicotianae]|uniref:Mitochondrial chaperone BCS1-B n=1 Tax=Phytophthora nicotianae TaxID=4792 RepID=A0A0W8D0W7_PHYNI|nr:mitochondrial chaperone BCS1-B [Phytophthora nicotianae]